jgi:hypothetical protein
MGNLKTANVFLFMINPSVELADYGTQSNEQFQSLLKAELAQSRSTCLALDPDYWWTSWFRYYSALFRPTLEALCKKSNLSYYDALKRCADKVAILELVPYFSQQASTIVDLFDELPSAVKAKAAAEEICLRAESGDVSVLIRWSNEAQQNDRWKLGKLPPERVKSSSSRSGFSKDARTFLLNSLADAIKKES